MVSVCRCFCVVGREEKQLLNGSPAQLQRELAELGRNLGVAAAGLGDLEHDLFPPVLSFLSCKMSLEQGFSRALPALKASSLRITYTELVCG